MTRVDQFESVFRSAVKDRYSPKAITLEKVLVVTDLDEVAVTDVVNRSKAFLGSHGWDLDYQVIEGNAFKTTHDLLNLCHKHQPDLICTYRNLQSEGWRYPHSLGEHLDVLLQKTDKPVLVMPHPRDEIKWPEQIKGVMAVTDHLTNDFHLIDHALHFAGEQGVLWLAHIEDETYFNRFANAISKIPSIDTLEATTRIKKQLLKEPHDYIASCRLSLRSHKPGVRVEEIVTFGHRLSQFQEHIQSHNIDLLVMNTKDVDQQAMHGLAYPLAIELRQLPLLML